MRSEFPFAAFLSYSPKGVSETSKNSQKACAQIKGGSAELIDLATRRLFDENGDWADRWFPAECTLVPIPGSAPRRSVDALWVPYEICARFQARVVSSNTTPLLRRVRAVQKSAYAAQGERPSAETHYSSFEVDAFQPAPNQRIVLVDDVITKGATLVGAYRRMREAFPEHAISLFALVRTKGRIEVENMIQPFEGTIVSERGETNRQD